MEFRRRSLDAAVLLELGGSEFEALWTPASTGEDELVDRAVPLEEPGFAVREVETPQSDKPLVEAEGVNLVEFRVECFTPLPECLGVVGG